MQTFYHTGWRPDTISIAWDLGNYCNQDCSYCLLVHKAGNFSNGSWEIVESFADKLLVFCEKAGLIPEIRFGGSGETTAVPYFGDLLRTLNNRARCSIETNLSPSIEWWENHGYMISGVHGTIHYEYITLRESAEKIQKIMEISNRVRVTVPMLPDRFQEQLDDISWMNDTLGISVGMQALFINPTDPLLLHSDYTPEQREILIGTDTTDIYVIKSDTDKNKTMTHSQVHWSENDSLREFTDWQCYAGIDTLVIDSRGYVRRGWCTQHTMEQVHMSEWQWSLEPQACRMMWCRHSHDLLARKTKDY